MEQQDNIIPFPPQQAPHLEQIEQLCVAYLAASETPLVLVSTLAEYCRLEPELEDLSDGDLLTFLRQHRDIQVLETPGLDLGDDPEIAMAAGIDASPRAVLRTRVPSERELVMMLAAQLESMLTQLDAARDTAQRKGRTEFAGRLGQALVQAEALRNRLRQFARGNAPAESE